MYNRLRPNKRMFAQYVKNLSKKPEYMAIRSSVRPVLL
jgi:hypothetical protein